MDLSIISGVLPGDLNITFVGVVEGRQDPCKLGQVQVRIIGLHDGNLNLLPTEKLPWAPVMMVAGGFSFNLPKEGDWVKGHFQDGLSRQMPIIDGYFHGVVPPRPKMPSADAKPQQGFVDPRSDNELKVCPVPPQGIILTVEGQPSTPQTAQGNLANTVIEKSNHDRVGECDFAIGVQHTISGVRFAVTTIAHGIRDGIKALLAALGISPSAGGTADLIKSLAAMLKRIARLIRTVNDGLNAVILFVKKIRAIIDYILSLPAQLLAMFQKCLQQAYKELATGFIGMISDVTGTGTSNPEMSASMKELQASYKDLASQTAQLITKPGQIIGAVVNPSTMTAQQRADMIKSLYPDSTHEMPVTARD